MATLFDYYKKQGKALPSMKDRATVFEQQGLGKAGEYAGTADQNTKLLGRLTAGGAAASATDPAQGGFGNQDPNRAGAAKIPTAEETRMNKREAAITESVDPQRRLVDRIVAEQSKLPSDVDILREERKTAGIPMLDEEIQKAQGVIDRITERLSSTVRFEEGRTIPMGLIRGRQREAELQAATELTPFETRLTRLSDRRGQAVTESSAFATARGAEARRPLEAAKSELELEKGLQPARDLVRDEKLKGLEKAKEPEYKVVGSSLVRISADGTVTPVFTPPKKGSGVDPEEKQVQAFLKDSSDMITKLDRGEISWGAAWDYLRTRYPAADPATIDATLGGSIDFNQATGEFGEAKGRAKTSVKPPGEKPKSAASGTTKKITLPDGSTLEY